MSELTISLSDPLVEHTNEENLSLATRMRRKIQTINNSTPKLSDSSDNLIETIPQLWVCASVFLTLRGKFSNF